MILEVNGGQKLEQEGLGQFLQYVYASFPHIHFDVKCMDM